MTWDPVIATTKCLTYINHAVWSPCSRFIAVVLESDGIQILDAATLEELVWLDVGEPSQEVAFSPDGHLLTWVVKWASAIMSLDVQTGIEVSNVFADSVWPDGVAYSITHSKCKTMIGVLFIDDPYNAGSTHDSTICIYNIHTHTHTQISHVIKRLAHYSIWTHGDCIQFATLGLGAINIWEVEFTSEDPPRQIKSLPTPNNFDTESLPLFAFLFFPPLSRLAYGKEHLLNVWDCQHSKHLLNPVAIPGSIDMMTFSSDGCFFACGTTSRDIYLWKESPTGYILHQIFTSRAGKDCVPSLSPNGQSIVVTELDIIELWHITDPTITPSSVLVPAPWYDKYFILGFSPDGSLAAVVRWAETTVTVLNLKSGVPQLVIETGMKVSGLGMTESTIIIVGDGKIIVWKLPMGDQVPNTRANISDGDQITTYDYSPFPEWTGTPLASVSPDFNYIAVVNHSNTSTSYLNIYDVFTGEHLASTKGQVDGLWFTPDGHEVWASGREPLYGWEIIKNSESNLHVLEPVDQAGVPLRGCPWKSSCGHNVTEEGWILSSSGKHLLWLPHHWRLDQERFMWHGQFLAVLHHTLPDAIILELLEE